LPYAIELLGPPDWASTDRDGTPARAAACAWTSPNVDALTTEPEPSPDHERFRRLLNATLTRVSEGDRGILIAAKPGWSYDHARPMSADTRRLMKSAGFIVQGRHA
jgi:hypothetical protein